MTTTKSATVPVTVRADDVPGPPQGCWTYDAYAAIPEDGRRYEIIDGVLYMAAAPSVAHQHAVVRFTALLTLAIEYPGLGQVFVAPTDVELAGAPLVLVQPDVIVVLNANLNIIKPGRIIGAPDVVVEVLSPGTAGYDRRSKQEAYARAGVAEYWIADPFVQTVELLMLEGGSYRSLGALSGTTPLASSAVTNLTTPVEQFFAFGAWGGTRGLG